MSEAAEVQESQLERVTVNGVSAVKMPLTIRKGAYSWAKHAHTRGKLPAQPLICNLMGILEGRQVIATAFSGTNVVGHTSAEQLRQAYGEMDPEYRFWIKEAQLEQVIAAFGDGKLGFDMGGFYCQETPKEIESMLASAPQPA
jgi:hypothetical protein